MANARKARQRQERRAKECGRIEGRYEAFKVASFLKFAGLAYALYLMANLVLEARVDGRTPQDEQQMIGFLIALGSGLILSVWMVTRMKTLSRQHALVLAQLTRGRQQSKLDRAPSFLQGGRR